MIIIIVVVIANVNVIILELKLDFPKLDIVAYFEHFEK